MKHIFSFFLMVGLLLGVAQAQSSTDLVGDYSLETPGLQGTLKLRNSAVPQQRDHVTLIFQGMADEAPQSFLVADAIVDGVLQQYDEKAAAVVPFRDILVRTELDGNVRYVVVYTADGLDYRFRKL